MRGCEWACLYAVYRENDNLNIHVPSSIEKKLLDIPTVLEKRPREDDVVFMETKTQEEILQEQLENRKKWRGGGLHHLILITINFDIN